MRRNLKRLSSNSTYESKTIFTGMFLTATLLNYMLIDPLKYFRFKVRERSIFAHTLFMFHTIITIITITQ